MKSARVFVLLLALCIAGPFAVALDLGWYAGFNAGESKAKIDDTKIARGLLIENFTMTSIRADERATGYKFFGGYQFNRNFAIEAGLFDLGTFGFSAATEPTGTLNGTVKLRGVNLDAVGILPVTEQFSLFARFGLNYAETRSSFTGTGSVNVIGFNATKSASNYKAGLGLQYQFTESFGIRIEAERYRIDDAIGNKGDVDLTSVGLTYRFNRFNDKKSADAPVREPATVVPVQVTFSTDSLFDFDQFAVQPEGQKALDKFAADLKGVNCGPILVTGHTDRINSHAYNMKLSRRRAEAVATYLVDSAGIPAEKIVINQVAETQPVTKPGECVGKRATKKLIACLRPDRRVVVDVPGSVFCLK